MKEGNMKLLIVFALIAVAYAEPDQIQVVNLPEAPSPRYAMPSIGQVIIPNAVIEAWKKDLEAIKVARPIMREAVIPNDEGLKVNFVDVPLDNAVPEPITLGEPLLPAFEIADDVVDAELTMVELVPEPVNFVEAPLPMETPVFVDGPPPLPIEDDVLAEPSQAELIPEPVNFVDAPLPMEDDVLAVPSQAELIPEPVKFVEAPLDVDAEASLIEVAPEPVKFVDSPLEAAVEPIKIARPSNDYRDKIFNNPMLRSAPTA